MDRVERILALLYLVAVALDFLDSTFRRAVEEDSGWMGWLWTAAVAYGSCHLTARIAAAVWTYPDAPEEEEPS